MTRSSTPPTSQTAVSRTSSVDGQASPLSRRMMLRLGAFTGVFGLTSINLEAANDNSPHPPYSPTESSMRPAPLLSSSITGLQVVRINPPLSTRARSRLPSIIVLHATAGSTARSSIDWLRSEGLGYHYVITRDGRDSGRTSRADNTPAIAFELVSPVHRVSHVGSQVLVPGNGTANALGIGVSLANLQNGEPYTVQQLVALDGLIRAITATYSSVRYLTTHAAIQPWNRGDPRDLDVRQLALRLGLEWFQPTAEEIRAKMPPRMQRAKVRR